MATYNRGVAERALANVVETTMEEEMERSGPPALQDLGIVDTQTGDSRVLDLSWMRRYSMMREWPQGQERGSETERELFMSRMRNRRFEDTIRFDIEDIEDDVGMLNPEGEAQSMVRAYEDRLEWEQHAYLINSFYDNYVGGSITGPYGETIYVGSLDGEPVLSDSHPYFKQIEFRENAPRGQRLEVVDGGEFSNLINTALSENALWSARQDFRELLNFRGQPANFGQPDTLIVPPALEREATQILELSQRIESDSNGVTAIENETQGLFDIYVDDYLTGEVSGVDLDFGGTPYTDQTIDLSKLWFLVNTTASVSPFLMWKRKPLELQRPVGTPDLDSDSPAEGEVSQDMFRHDAVKMGARARFGMSFGMPQVIYGSLGGNTLS